MSRLKDKVCVVTGGASGLGEKCVLDFLKYDGIVYALDYNVEGLKSLAAVARDVVGEKSENLKTKVIDVSNTENVNKVVKTIVEEAGRIDVLINNAGITRDSTLIKMSDEQFDQVIAVNLKGVFLMARAVAPVMKGQGNGSIVNVSSVVGVYGNFGQTNYAAAKAGVIGMTKTWARELGKNRVRVNAVAPGFIQTAMTEKVPEKVLDIMTQKTLVKRLGTPDDVSNLYTFLASDESTYITGQVIGVDGGLVT